MSNSVPGAQNFVREPVINFVYFRDTYNWDKEFYNYYYGVSSDDSFNYFKSGYQCKEYGWLTRGDKFASKLIPGTYYFYIITPQLESMFRKELANRGYDKWVVWESREYAENYNYPGEARLKAVMLKCPDDFKPVNSTEK